MNELQKLLLLEPEKLDTYVKDRKTLLDSTKLKQTYGGNDEPYCINGWINSSSIFLPSGFRKRGFILDSEQLYIKFVNALRETLKDIDFTSNIIKEFMVLTCNMFLVETFDTAQGMDTALRNKIYAVDSLKDILTAPVNVETLFGLGVTRCIERAAIINNLLAFIGIDSNLIIGNANLKGEYTGHAYCIVRVDENYILFDPSIIVKTINGHAYPLIVAVSNETLEKDKIEFDISEWAETYEDDILPNQGSVLYEFPGKQFCSMNNIDRKRNNR